jgi:prophage tail gpP-like protein
MASILLEVNGVSYEGFTSIGVTRTIEAVSGSFNFETTINNSSAFPIKVGDSCRVIVEGVPVLTGFVEVVNVNYSAGAHSIAIQGRDRTADVIDSSLQEEIHFEGTISLVRIIQRVLSNLGIIDIGVTDLTGGIEDFTERESGEIGMSAFEFIEQYARKRQVLLTTDGAGNIGIIRGAGVSISSRLKNVVGSSDSNILRSNVSYDYAGRFGKYIVESQGNPSLPDDGGEKGAATVVERSGEAVDSKVRSTRILTLNAESSLDSQTDKQRAQWEANIRRSRSQTYSATLQGFLAPSDGIIWAPNQLVNIQDDFADINAIMLVKSVTYSQSLDEGSITELQFVVKDSYTLQAEQNALEANVNKLGDIFTSSGGEV